MSFWQRGQSTGYLLSENRNKVIVALKVFNNRAIIENVA
jgi:hypothetical protein